MAEFFLSPSRLARYFYHDCDRYLRYVATPMERRGHGGVPAKAHDSSPVAQLLLDGGYRWEQQVVTTHLKGRVHVAPGKGPLHERTHSVSKTLGLLASPNGKTIYQGTLSPPRRFLARYGLDPKLVEFRQCRPDLIEPGDDARLQVIDLKASDELKTSHRIQVALYALLLRDILAEGRIGRDVDLGTGGVWLYGAPEPERFDLGMTIGIVEGFLRDKLAAILSAPLEKVNWHLYFRCEWCEYFEACREQAERTRSVSLIPYLSVGARRYLHDAPWGGEPVESLRDMAVLLERDDAHAVLEACGSLRGKADRLSHAVDALLGGKVVPHGGSTMALPVFENVTVILGLQREPVSGQVYAAGFRRLKGKDVFGSGVSEQVFVASSEEDCERVGREFILALHKELGVLHSYNEKHEDWAEKKSLQLYVFDSFEERLYTELLLEALEEPALAPAALQLLLHHQGPELAGTEEQPRVEIPYPIIVLTSVLRELVALPSPLAVKLDSALAVLKSPTFDYDFKTTDLFAFQLSNALRSEPIFMAWNGTHPDAVDWVSRELRKRLIAAGTLVDGLRAVVGKRLFAWPPKFSLPGALDFQHPELSKLAFVVHYESFMAACANRQSRSGPWKERVRNGVSIPLRSLGGQRWKVESALDEAVIEQYGDFRNGLLVPASEQGDRDQMAYDDHRNRQCMFAPKTTVRLAKVDGWTSREDGHVDTIDLTVIPNSKVHDPFQRGDKAVLQRRVTDFVSDQIVKRLVQLDAEPGCALVRLLREPRGYNTRIRPDAASRAAVKLASRASFTASQRAAFDHIAGSRLTLVWGPPGTGKTHFLAKSIRLLAAGSAKAGRSLRVAVTAFTHAAIENLLREIADCSVPGSEGLMIAKLGTCNTPRGQGLPTLGTGMVASLEPDESFVVGGTVHAFRKEYDKATPEFDVLVVDEGSQMKLGEFALATLALGETTRLVIAGDDLQLPPIIQGSYPEPDDGLRGLHDSVFSYLRDRDHEDGPYTCQLLENWRMNEVLTRFSAEALYGPGYVPATDEVARRRLRLAPEKRRKSDFITWMLDPDHPMVVCVLDGVQAAVENRVEAEIVADLATRIRSRILTDDGKRYAESEAGDKAFWARGLFVVSPHHVQIRAIHRALHRRREWLAAPFVDTVDKMQGQQTEAVIVSYGVSDPETALSEGEFIYSLNRLNVSVTRARAKSVIFLPRPLLEPSFDVLGNDQASRGLGHMLKLLEFCRAGEERVVPRGELGDSGGASLTMFRI